MNSHYGVCVILIISFNFLIHDCNSGNSNGSIRNHSHEHLSVDEFPANQLMRTPMTISAATNENKRIGIDKIPFDCLNPKGIYGHCINLEECEPLFKELREGNNDKSFLLFLQKSHCGWAGVANTQQPKVCCLSAKSNTALSSNSFQHNKKSENKLPFDETVMSNEISPLVASKGTLEIIASHPNLHLLPTTKDCGLNFPPDKIVAGGRGAGLGAYPWTVLLGFQERGKPMKFACGGTLINSRYVLTSAHCCSNLPQMSELKVVRVGDYELGTDPDCFYDDDEFCAEKVQDILIEEIIVHEKYDRNKNKENDIALIRLSHSAVLGPFVQMVCLPTKEFVENIPENSKGNFVAGWGRTDYRSNSDADILEDMNVRLIPLKQCEDYYKNKTNGAIQTLESNRFCAGDGLGKYSCKVDSGGPLMKHLRVQDHHGIRIFQLGVFSLGPLNSKCGSSDQPALFTKVTEVMPWILNNLRP